MAKRKAAVRQAGRKTSGGRKAAVRSRGATRKTAARKATPKRRAAKKTAKKTAKPSRRPAPRATAPRATARKRPAARAAGPARPAPPKRTAKASTAKSRSPVSARSAPPTAGKKRASIPVMRKPPGLDRERRIARDEDELVPESPPSSLDLDRTASAVRTGRRALKDRFDEHTETSPALTAGDVDADWESAYSVGDEAPGGDNPTPDQDIVDDIGRAVGVEYQDNEELKGEEKIAKRDRNRWELDPASSDDWDDR